MNYTKILLFAFTILISVNCGKTIIKVNSPTSNPEGKDETYHKRYVISHKNLEVHGLPLKMKKNFTKNQFAPKT